jgi:tetratricopeptide (TPR) repeat protein
VASRRQPRSSGLVTTEDLDVSFAEPAVAATEEDEPTAEETPDHKQDEQRQLIDTLEADKRRAGIRIEELETELRRIRRRAGEHLNLLAARLEAVWTARRLPTRVLDLPDEIDADQLTELRELAGPMRTWGADFGLGNAEMHYHLGLIAVLENDFEEGVRCFERAAFDGKVPDGWLALADCQWQLERPKTAAKSYIRCLEHKRMPAHIFQRVAQVAIQERRYDDAIQTLQRVMSRKNVPQEIYALASMASRELGDPEQAVAHCEEGLKRHEGSVLLLSSMIIPLSETGDDERAERCANLAQEIDSECPAVPYSLGVMRMSNGKEDTAVELFEEALVLDPEYPEALFRLGVIHNRRGQFKKALEYFKPAVELKPDFAEAYFNMKDSYEGLRDFDNAIAMLNRAVQLNPDYS